MSITSMKKSATRNHSSFCGTITDHGFIHDGFFSRDADLTGVLFGETQRRCYPEDVAIETTLPDEHPHICQRTELISERALHLDASLEKFKLNTRTFHMVHNM